MLDIYCKFNEKNKIIFHLLKLLFKIKHVKILGVKLSPVCILFKFISL